MLPLSAVVMWYFSHVQRLHLFVDGVYGRARFIKLRHGIMWCDDPWIHVHVL